MESFIKGIIIILFMYLISACSSPLKERVITRSDDLDERPNWAQLSETMFQKEGKLFSVGISEHDIDAKIPAVIRIADNNARFEISRLITDDLSYIFQNMEEGVNDGGELTRFYASEISKNMAHGIKQEKRYWEKVQTYDSQGERVFKLRVFSLASIKESDFKKAIKEAINKANRLDPKIKEKINNHLSNEIEKLSQN